MVQVDGDGIALVEKFVPGAEAIDHVARAGAPEVSLPEVPVIDAVEHTLVACVRTRFHYYIDMFSVGDDVTERTLHALVR